MPPKKPKLSNDSDESPSTSSKVEEKFTFFWKAHSPFSQFHPTSFNGSPLFIRTEEDSRGYTFLHCEQWMMFNKAKLFSDEDSARQILATTAPPRCKALGRKVKNFDEKIWKQHNEAIIMEGNRLKFSQNPKLLSELLKTDGTTLVEASPFDRLYGIGLSADNPKAQNRATWRGKNLLGEILTKLRDQLKQQDVCQPSDSTDGKVVASIKFIVHDTIDKQLDNK